MICACSVKEYSSYGLYTLCIHCKLLSHKREVNFWREILFIFKTDCLHFFLYVSESSKKFEKKEKSDVNINKFWMIEKNRERERETER